MIRHVTDTLGTRLRRADIEVFFIRWFVTWSMLGARLRRADIEVFFIRWFVTWQTRWVQGYGELTLRCSSLDDLSRDKHAGHKATASWHWGVLHYIIRHVTSTLGRRLRRADIEVFFIMLFVTWQARWVQGYGELTLRWFHTSLLYKCCRGCQMTAMLLFSSPSYRSLGKQTKKKYKFTSRFHEVCRLISFCK
jgi:hypothetical protein